MLRILGGVVVLLLVVASIAAFVYRHELRRLHAVTTLFEPDRIVQNFRSMDTIFEIAPVFRGDELWELAEGETVTLPASFDFGGETMDTAAFLEYTHTTGLIVLHNDRIVFEEYYLDETPATRHISWSVAKSFVSALVGIALHEGHIDDIMDPVTKYAPVLAGSGYDGVPLKDVLQMSSGVAFNEDYADFYSDINRMGRTIALSTPIEAFVNSLPNEVEPGTRNLYVSMDTQVLAMVLHGATGRSLADLTTENLWKPMGMESDAYWMVDSVGKELAFGCLNAVLRDYARFGLLYLHGGQRDGEQIVPAEWVRDSVTPDGDHLLPRDDVTNPNGLGYGYQWWVPARSDGDYTAVGVYDQFVYVNPRHRVVIAKTSANPHYLDDKQISKTQSIEMFRAIAEHVAGR